MHRNPAQETIVNLIKLKQPNIKQEHLDKVKLRRDQKVFIAIYKTRGEFDIKLTRTVKISYDAYKHEFKKVWQDIKDEEEFLLTKKPQLLIGPVQDPNSTAECARSIIPFAPKKDVITKEIDFTPTEFMRKLFNDKIQKAMRNSARSH